MGNCLRHGSSSSSMQWGGDDWGLSDPDPDHDHDHDYYHKAAVKTEEEEKAEEKGRLLGGDGGGGGFRASSTTKEVKIKITKRQLEELLGRAELKELSVQQVLAQLMKVSSDRYETHQRSWRPALQSIPEVN